MNEVDYMNHEEAAGIGRFLEQVKRQVRERNDGRNLDYWPILSFGWKDADLEPGGCTGIKDIRWKDEETLVVEVGGHKTFCYSEADNEDEETAHSWDAESDYLVDALFGWTVEGNEGETTASFEEEVEVKVVFDAKLDVDMDKTVDAIVTQAEAACDKFEDAMKEVNKGFEEICEANDGQE